MKFTVSHRLIRMIGFVRKSEAIDQGREHAGI